MSTRPSDSAMAVMIRRRVVIEPVGLKAPVLGSYSSAESQCGHGPWPPATRTRPSDSRGAVGPKRGVAIEPVELNGLWARSKAAATTTATSAMAPRPVRIGSLLPRAVLGAGLTAISWLPLPMMQSTLGHPYPQARE